MFERFARSAREVVAGAVEEAGHRGDRGVGTDHLLLALLDRRAPDPAAALLTALAVDPQTVRRRLSVG